MNSSGTPGRKRPYFSSLKLSDIYETIFMKKPEFPHEAESDVQSMLKVAICTEGFLDAVDRNAVLFRKLSKAWWLNQIVLFGITDWSEELTTPS